MCCLVVQAFIYACRDFKKKKNEIKVPKAAKKLRFLFKTCFSN